MVSKVLLAVGETIYREYEAGGASAIVRTLVGHYYDIRSGLGGNKTPGEYGAFPMDPYSHTPAHTGARQPGMTGQVKEDILSQWNELGVLVRKGSLVFDPLLLRRSEFLDEPGTFEFYDVQGQRQSLLLEPGTLAFTYCQAPVVYHLSEDREVRLSLSDDTSMTNTSLKLDASLSGELFARTDRIRRIDVFFEPVIEFPD